MHRELCKNISRRTFIITGIATLATLGLSWRFFNLQILENSYYNKLSENNKTKLLATTANRGSIIDCDGVEIAVNKRLYNIFCNSREIKDKKLVLDILSEILKFSPSDVENFNKSFEAKKTFLVKSTFSWNKISLLEFKSNHLSGIYINQEYKRFYPFGEILSHIVGYTVACDNSYCGKLGIEALYDEKLKNKPGIIKREVNSKGKTVREIESKEPVSGSNVQISISAKLQSYMYVLLKEYKGSISVLDVKSGMVKAIVNSPSYNNNIFSRSISNEEWNKLNHDKNMPLINRALSSTFQPGSTFKPISSLAALEKGIIDKNTKIKCDGSIRIGNRIFHCWKRFGHGEINITDAIAQSCNIFFYKLALQLKIDDVVRIASEFGLGDITFTRLKEESNGMIPVESWREKNLKGRWSLGDSVNTVIGHGYLLCTPFQLAVMTARIASGKKVIPTFECGLNLHMNSDMNSDVNSNRNFEGIKINEKNLIIVRDAMLNSVNSSLGTSRRSASTIQKIAGKTGTAQVLNTENLHLTENKEHSLFIGYAPYDDPKYCISVVLENAGTGGVAAKLAVKSLDFIVSN